MTISLYDVSIPLLTNALTDMSAWLDKPDALAAEARLIDAKLAPDMLPFTAQYQIASDSARKGIARLTGIEAPDMADTETSFAQLKDRCARTITFLQSVEPEQINGNENREIVLKFPNGMGYSFTGLNYLKGFMLPNFFFHVTTAYAILRAQGIAIGKQDFLAHLGPPDIFPAP